MPKMSLTPFQDATMPVSRFRAWLERVRWLTPAQLFENLAIFTHAVNRWIPPVSAVAGPGWIGAGLGAFVGEELGK
jgi:hypothetical protein